MIIPPVSKLQQKQNLLTVGNPILIILLKKSSRCKIKILNELFYAIFLSKIIFYHEKCSYHLKGIKIWYFLAAWPNLSKTQNFKEVTFHKYFNNKTIQGESADDVAITNSFAI